MGATLTFNALADMQRLSEFAHNVYSQFGEDGIIEQILAIVGASSRRCIEFGAWDGFHFSNTANLWTRGWRAVLIEADARRYRELERNTQAYGCRCIHGFVRTYGDHSLERILKAHDIDFDVDLLSIDVDGDDYFIFESLRDLKPRVVICEYNPTIPAHVELVPEPGNFFGCSVLSLVRLAEAKGYALVAVTDTNALFVRREEHHRFDGYVTSLEALASDKYVTYLMCGYGGDYVASAQPVYGCRYPSRQRFARGSPYLLPLTRAVGNRLLHAMRRLLP